MIHWLVLLIALPVAHANSASSNTWLSCAEFMMQLENGRVTKEVCAELQILTTNFTMDDGSESIANQVNTYNILEVPNGIDVFEVSNSSEYLSGTIVNVTRSFIEGSCFVAINGTACTNCEMCGRTTVSVDCSTIPGGRTVECESVEYVYFPFEGYILPRTATDDGIDNTATDPVLVNTTTNDVLANSTTDDVFADDTTLGGKDSTNPPLEGDNNTPEESSSYRSMVAFIAVMVVAVGTFLQL